MLDRSRIFYNFSGIIFGFIAALTLTYFLTQLIFDALVNSLVLFLYGTAAGGLSVVQQLIFLLN